MRDYTVILTIKFTYKQLHNFPDSFCIKYFELSVNKGVLIFRDCLIVSLEFFEMVNK